MKAKMNRESRSQPNLIKLRGEERTIETKRNESTGFSNNRMKSSKLVSETLSDKSNRKIQSNLLRKNL